MITKPSFPANRIWSPVLPVRYLPLILLLIAVFTVAAVAWQTAPALKPNTPFQITFDHEKQDSQAQYRWWCGGVIVKNFSAVEVVQLAPAGADGMSTLSATVPGLPLGKHSCFVSAFNEFGEEKGAPIQIPVGGPPSAPLRLRYAQQ